ncbi:MAG TPA: hypothetical protein VLK65_23880 [Vicinamibacteria bacterium]|nr:hypothetical protein [Vicinamibacteria bacterium]
MQLEDDERWYTWNEITGSDTFSTHDPDGDTLYGSDITVHSDFRGRAIAGPLYKARKKLLKTYNLKRMVAYGRIPGYQDHAGEMTPEECVSAVQRGKLKDSALTAHLKADYEPKRILFNYGQAGIYTPSDFSFPLEAKLAEAEPNIETVVISEIDLGSLNQQRHVGSVRPLQDLRTDL